MPRRRALLLLVLAAVCAVWWASPGFVQTRGADPRRQISVPIPAERAPRSDPVGALRAFVLGDQARARGASADALAHYERAAALAPGTPLFLSAAARTAREARQPARALEPLRRLERLGVLDPAQQAALIGALARGGDLVQAEQVARRALERNPYDTQALEAWRAAVAGSGNAAAEHELVERLRAVERDPYLRSEPLRVVFDPPQPALHIREPRQLGGQMIYDHSEFRVALHNPTLRPVVVDTALIVSAGTGAQSGLGDVVARFRFASPARELAPGASAELDQSVFGFSVDTAHVQLSYVFELCWHGLPADPPQCAQQSLDLLPPLDELP